MTTPLWALLAFAAWTLLTLANTVGVYRWGHILTGRSRIEDFSHYTTEKGSNWYRRSLRAHANCVENLPAFGAIVLVLTASGLQSTILDVLTIVVIAARIPHTLVHVAFEQRTVAVSFRSAFFNVQWLAMMAMIVVLVANLAF